MANNNSNAAVVHRPRKLLIVEDWLENSGGKYFKKLVQQLNLQKKELLISLVFGL
jgi:hypothetical protein